MGNRMHNTSTPKLVCCLLLSLLLLVMTVFAVVPENGMGDSVMGYGRSAAAGDAAYAGNDDSARQDSTD
ncbi:MAG: hypothetical protein IJ302_00055, partial [Clostridia bacterium]|nr:hypothetical protein [Clostridia bacterium]